ncbi:Scr1 family TA system antitoxin-like transcriptional regulator [Streptomyces decoyicus]|uniref:Scr1 family TA system antitoxin-like transcriptional regulator n=1 Tax=Streptomyces decoyicus TaxID=249567 RepID=UPI0036364BEB
MDGRRRRRTEREVQTFAELRLQRAAVLTGETPLPVWCVLNEAALRRTTGGPSTRPPPGPARPPPPRAAPGAPFAAGTHPAMDGTHTLFRCDARGPVEVKPMATSLHVEEDAE